MLRYNAAHVFIVHQKSPQTDNITNIPALLSQQQVDSTGKTPFFQNDCDHKMQIKGQ